MIYIYLDLLNQLNSKYIKQVSKVFTIECMVSLHVVPMYVQYASVFVSHAHAHAH